MSTDRFNEAARRVVGGALLTAWNERHPIPREASSGRGIDIDRAGRLLKDLDRESLHALLMATTKEAFTKARAQLDEEMDRIHREVLRAAEHADSLMLHRYAARIAERRQDLAAQAAEPVELDPLPWVTPTGIRYASPAKRVPGSSGILEFSPREAFEQDRGLYPKGVR